MTLPPTARQTVFPFVAYVFPAPVLSQQPGPGLAVGESVIKFPSTLNVLKYNTTIAVIEHVHMNIST